MKTYFENLVISSRSDISAVCETWKAMDISDKTESNFALVKNALDLFNVTMKNGAVSVMLYDENHNVRPLRDILVSLSCIPVSVTEKDKQNAQRVANAVCGAVNVRKWSVTMTSEKNLAFNGHGKNIITFSDLVKMRTAFYTNGHADGKKKAEDRTKALADLINGENLDFFMAFRHSAFMLENVNDSTEKAQFDLDEKSAGIFSKISKSASEKWVKLLGEKVLEKDIAFHKCHALYIAKRIYTANGKAIVKHDRETLINAFVTATRYAFNGLDIPEIEKEKTFADSTNNMTDEYYIR